jgi:hypothetical protein
LFDLWCEPELIRADMPTKHFFVLIKLSID